MMKAVMTYPSPDEEARMLAMLTRRGSDMIGPDTITGERISVSDVDFLRKAARRVHVSDAIMRYAEAHGILCLMNSNAEEGVTQAASLQLGASASNLWPFGHAYRSPLRLAGDISTFSDHIHDGWVSLPKEPGLGVTLKPDMLERFLIRRHTIPKS